MSQRSEHFPHPAEQAERVPPQNIQVEMSVLGGIMLEPKEAYPLVANYVTADSFYFAGHGQIFQIMGELHSKGIPPDSVAVLDALRAQDNLHIVGGSGVVLGMLNSVPTAANVEYHAKIVREKYWRRQMIRTCTRIIDDAYREDISWERLCDRAESGILKISEFGGAEDEPTHIATVLDTYLSGMSARVDEIDRLKASGQTDIDVSPGIRTGYPDLDRQLGGGLRAKELTVIAARPSKGKSALAANIMHNLTVGNQRANRESIPVLLFTIEMGEEQVAERLLSRGTYAWSQQLGKQGVSVNRLRNPDLAGAEWTLVQHSYERLKQAPIYLWDKGIVTPRDMRAVAGGLLRKHKQLVVFIDYLQLLTAQSSNDNMVARVTEVSQASKQLAKDYGIPVVALSQFSREVEKQKRRPVLSDLRESGAIEQDADAVIFIHPRDEVEAQTGFHLVELIVAKNRNGALGTVYTRFDADLMRFTSAAPNYRAPEPARPNGKQPYIRKGDIGGEH